MRAYFFTSKHPKSLKATRSILLYPLLKANECRIAVFPGWSFCPTTPPPSPFSTFPVNSFNLQPCQEPSASVMVFLDRMSPTSITCQVGVQPYFSGITFSQRSEAMYASSSPADRKTYKAPHWPWSSSTHQHLYSTASISANMG